MPSLGDLPAAGKGAGKGGGAGKGNAEGKGGGSGKGGGEGKCGGSGKGIQCVNRNRCEILLYFVYGSVFPLQRLIGVSSFFMAMYALLRCKFEHFCLPRMRNLTTAFLIIPGMYKAFL